MAPTALAGSELGIPATPPRGTAMTKQTEATIRTMQKETDNWHSDQLTRLAHQSQSILRHSSKEHNCSACRASGCSALVTDIDAPRAYSWSDLLFVAKEANKEFRELFNTGCHETDCSEVGQHRQQLPAAVCALLPQRQIPSTVAGFNESMRLGRVEEDPAVAFQSGFPLGC